MAKYYYTLAVLEPGADELFKPQFGDYRRAVVEQEWSDTRRDYPRGSKCAILKSRDSQSSIDDAINALNDALTKSRKAEL